jgi:stress response protein YsnF
MVGDNPTLPLLSETVTIGRHKRVTAKVRVQVRPNEREELFDIPLTDQRVEVERVQVGRFIDTPPPVRVEGDITIVPVVEERAVVSVRLFLREELWVRTVRATRIERRAINLRTETVEVQRLDLPEGEDAHE